MKFDGFIKIKPLGQLLLEKGLITQQQLEEAVEIQKTKKQSLGDVLINLGFVSEEQLYHTLAEQQGIEILKYSDINNVDKNLFTLIPEEVAQKYLVFPISKDDVSLTLAMKNPFNISVIDVIHAMISLKIKPVYMTEKDLKVVIDKYYAEARREKILEEAKEEEYKDEVEDKEEYKEIDAPVVKYVDNILKEVVQRKVSDIHIEPRKNYALVRFREDGVLYEVEEIKKSFQIGVVSRVKVLSNLDIAERRLPQDGKLRVNIENKDIDIRVSTLPTVYGEKLVMRILDKSNLKLNIEEIGFEKDEYMIYKEILSKSYGMILVTGPTGSGKTTTLYSGINYINSPDKNITTIEDPVEYELEGVNQTNVKPEINLTFANVLRSILRQDPDVILVGEIRDKETAEISIHAALTGHLVLSTLHTNNSIATITRLLHIGLEPVLLSSSLLLVISQRLIRLICPNCKQEVEPSQEMLSFLKSLSVEPKEIGKFYKGKGCDNCRGSGYKGRGMVVEMLKVDDEIRQLILNNAGEIEIREKAIKKGFRTLQQSSLLKIKNGLTTVEEVIKLMVG